MNPPQDDSDMLPARMLNEFVYCHRLFYMEYVGGDFEDSNDTIEGRVKHRRVDMKTGTLPEANDLSSEMDIRATSVLLSGQYSGLIARMDLVEGKEGNVFPVEYKKGKAPDLTHGIWESDKAQLTAQVMILRENGYKCNGGILYYSGSKERIFLSVDDGMIEWVKEEVQKAKTIASSGITPPPLIDSHKCVKCSLVAICLPDEINSLNLSEKNNESSEVRRLYPARQDLFPMYVQEQGAVISKRNEELVIKRDGETLGSSKIMGLASLSLFGNVQISTQTIRELCSRNIPICYFSTGGWFDGITHGMSHKNVGLRIRQYSVATDPGESMKLAVKFIEGKIKNCRTILRRNGNNRAKTALDQMSKLALRATMARNPEELLGIEGLAGRIYYRHFTDMIKVQGNDFDFELEGRNRRPPRDPVNACLSYLYALLTKDFTVSILTVGMDPYLGFFHRPKYGKPALALDLMEEFRPIICDSVAISVINNGEITARDFIKSGSAVSFNSVGRKKLISAYERRLDNLIKHPIFDYSLSYRRIFEVQTRMVGRLLNGEIPEYPPFVTR
ncbi:MAG: CRISPR-associated endonuclease Cas1 [Thermoplasmatales archaeon]